MSLEFILYNIIGSLLNTGVVLSISYYYLPRSTKLQQFFKTYWGIFHPNVISSWRGIAGPIFGYIIYNNLHTMSQIELTCLIQIIVYLANTDALDGKVAQYCNMKTEIGKSFDALCDKLFDLPILLALSYHIHEYLFIMICVIGFVDIVGQSLRSRMNNPAAERVGKTKTCFKFISMIVLFLYVLSSDIQSWGLISSIVLYCIVLFSLVFAIWSMGIKLKNSSIFA